MGQQWGAAPSPALPRAVLVLQTRFGGQPNKKGQVQPPRPKTPLRSSLESEKREATNESNEKVRPLQLCLHC